MKKVIIQTCDTAQLFAILLVNEDSCTAGLEYFMVKTDGGLTVQKLKGDYFDHEGTMEWAKNIKALAKEELANNHPYIRLIKY